MTNNLAADNMELYACGLNAHQQLQPNAESQDLYTFQKVAEGSTLRIFCTLWSATVLEIDCRLVFRGYHASGLTNCTISGPRPQRSNGVISIFGDLNGVIGALTPEGGLLELVKNEQRPDELIFRRRQQVWLQHDGNVIEHVSIAGNGKVAAITRKSLLVMLYVWISR